MVPFVYLASVCRSLQCLTSALTQAGGGGLLFRFACSIVLWGGRGTTEKCRWPMWGAVAVFQPHWVCPHSWHMCFPCLHCSGSRLLYREWALSCLRFQFWGTPQKHRPGWAYVLCLPRPEQLRRPGVSRVHSPRLQCTLSPQWSQPQFPHVPVRCTLYLFWGAGL